MVSHPWAATLLVAVGSALGGVIRFWITTGVGHLTGPSFPWGTVVVNVAGCALIGAVMGHYTDPMKPGAVAAQQFLAVGVLGGFTTFSSFSLQTLILMRDGEWSAAAVNVVGSVIACLAATWVGYQAAGR